MYSLCVEVALHQGMWQDTGHFKCVKLAQVLFRKQDAFIVMCVAAVSSEAVKVFGVAKPARDYTVMAVTDYPPYACQTSEGRQATAVVSVSSTLLLPSVSRS